MGSLAAIHAASVPADAPSQRIVDELEAAGMLTTDHAVVRDGRLHLELTGEAIAALRRLRVDVAVGDDVRESARRVQHVTRAPLHVVHGERHVTGFVDGYLDDAALDARFSALHAAFPALTEYRELPHRSHGGRPVKLFRISTDLASTARPALLFLAGTHGHEWIPPLAAVELAEQLLRNLRCFAALLDQLDWLIVPALNPDGIHLAHHGDPAWRKNGRPPPPGATTAGVDLGRNFGVGWGLDEQRPGHETQYPGPAAFSEPETRNVRALIERFPGVLTAIDCHSRGERFRRPQPGVGPALEPIPAGDHAVYLVLEAAMNAGIAEVSPGKAYASGWNAGRAGTCDEYLYFGHRVFAFELECGQAFHPPIADAQLAALEVAAAALALGARALALHAELGPPEVIVHVLDDSASVRAAGGVEACRDGARRLVDLATPDERAEIIELGAGGWTSIGGALETAAAAGAGQIILLTDGHENRAPMIAAVLPALPPGLKVHAIALGVAADQQVLQDLAAATGGSYFFCPEPRALPELHNFARADATGEQLVHNESAAIDAAADDGMLQQRVAIEGHATSVTFCVTLTGAAGEPEVSLVPPGRTHALLPRPLRRDGHWIVRVRRPEAGTWRVRVRPPRLGGVVCNVAAFVRSSLRLALPELSSQIPLDTLLQLEPRILDGDTPIRCHHTVCSVLAPMMSPGQLVRSARPAVRHERIEQVDALPAAVHEALALRHAVMLKRGVDPIAHRPLPGPFAPPAPIPGGSYNLRYLVRGNSPRTGPFVRVGLRSVYLDA